jgi:hypothetical protein
MSTTNKRDYYLKNLERIKTYQKEYRIKNKERKRQYDEKRQEISKGKKKEMILDILSDLEHRTIEYGCKRYYVASNGRIFSEIKEIKTTVIPNGYKVVYVGKTKLAHRVVWEAFNGEIPQGMEIDHINTDRGDNRLCNLRLVTSKENKNNTITKKRYRDSNKGKISEKLINAINERKKAVCQYTLQGVLVKEWDSACEAERYGFSRNCIKDCCMGRQKTHKNFIWMYKKNT